MVTRNFKNMLNMALGSAATNYGALPLRDVTGAVRYAVGNFTFPYSRTAAAALSETAAGISVGSGTTAASESNYNLEAHIGSGISLSLSNTAVGCEAPGNPYVEYQVTVTNTGSEAITVGEIGYKQNLKAAAKPGSSSVADYVCLLDRTVLATPLEIQGGDAGVIVYRLVTNPTGGKVVSGVTMASWTWGTDEQIAAMLDAAQAGTIDLQRDAGWMVGEIRTIPIAAFTGGNSVAHAAQNIEIAISSFDDYNECGCVMQFDFVNALAEFQRMNATNTTAGGYGATEMYTDTLPALVEALPGWLKSRLKVFDVLASKGGSELSTIETVGNNKLALRSAVEVFGAGGNGQAGEGAQLDYYKTTANRIKTKGILGSANGWWERSASSSTNFCSVYSTGSTSFNTASTAYGVAPFGCI